MAFNGTGTFVRIYNWVTDQSNSINIEAPRMDGEDDGFATGLSNCITKDGQTTITANIPMNSKKFTGLTNGSARTDSIALGQVQDNTFEYLGENGGAADAYTWAPSPAITAYTEGQSWIITIGTSDDNTTASTADISAVGSRAIEKSDGAGATTALESDDMVAGGLYQLIDNGAALVLQNPEKPFFGNFDATETDKGIVEIANQTEVDDGTDSTRMVTPLTLTNRLNFRLISETSISADAVIDFIDLTEYSSYKFILENVVPVTNAVFLGLRISTDNGTTFDSGSNYRWTNYSTTSDGSSAIDFSAVANNRIALTAVDGGFEVGNSASSGVSGEISLSNLTNSSGRFSLNYHLNYVNSGGPDFAQCIGSGQLTANTVVDAIRFAFSSGNLSTGTIKLYGIR